MSYFNTTTAYGSTGVKTITCGFQPTGIRITMGKKFGISNTNSKKSVGTSDGTNQICLSNFQDTTGGLSEESVSKLISHWDRVSGTITEVVSGTFDSFTATAGKFNITIPNANYDLIVELWN